MACPTFKASGFTALPVSYSKDTTHYIYARAHVSNSKKNVKQKEKQKTQLPSGRTLFLVNVPPDATERELVKFFKSCGTVEKAILDFDVAQGQQDDLDSDDEGDQQEEEDEDEMNVDEAGTSTQQQHQPRKRAKIVKDEPPKVAELPSQPHRTLRKTGLRAYVVFLDSSSLERALVLSSKPRAWPTSTEEPCGLAHYNAVFHALRPPLDAIRTHVDTYMELFEWRAAKEKQKSKYLKGEAVVDEDGFTLVTRGGAYGKTLGGGVAVATKQFQRSGATSARTRTKKKVDREGFYAFQKAEKQRSELMNLKQKWEEDKAKVEKLKASRRFRPY